jgi:hypothetical protein
VRAHGNHVPSYAKLLMIGQSLIITYFVFWTLEEYANNYYFQSYVNGTLQGSGFALIAISIVGVFSAVAAGLYMKLRQTRMELLHLAVEEEKSSGPTEDHGTDSLLSPHVEQHLINMIRKSAPPDSASASMPVLKKEEPSGQAR